MEIRLPAHLAHAPRWRRSLYELGAVLRGAHREGGPLLALKFVGLGLLLVFTLIPWAFTGRAKDDAGR